QVREGEIPCRYPRSPANPRRQTCSSTSSAWCECTTRSNRTWATRSNSSALAQVGTAVRQRTPRSPRATSWPSLRPSATIEPPMDTNKPANGIAGPLFMGKDTHALSDPAQRAALEVLAGNGVKTMIQRDNGVTPTPVVSHAILGYNRGRKDGLADGIVITPSH